MIKTGTLIDGKYKVLDRIGVGGMSSVYLALNEKANKQWAIKEVRKNRNNSMEVVRKSLIAETNMLKKLRHKNLPSIIDVIDWNEKLLIVMDYIEGVTLEELVSDKGAQKEKDVVKWAIQLCDVLDYLHSQEPSVIYRDMKPSNIMLKDDGSVVLIDFGTAREYKEEADCDTSCLGTRGYAAPEQFNHKGQTDARTDIYCLGVTLYRLVTGYDPTQPPYEMRPITDCDASLSAGLEAIICKCTRKNPDDRFQSVGELRGALEHYREYDKQRLKRNIRTLGVFGLSTVFSGTCVGISMTMERYNMGMCSKIFLLYSVTLLITALCMYFLFDIRGMVRNMVKVYKNMRRLSDQFKIQYETTAETDDDDFMGDDVPTAALDLNTMRLIRSRTAPLTHSLAVVAVCILAIWMMHPINVKAADANEIKTLIEENIDGIEIVDVAPSLDGASEDGATMYVISVAITDNDSNEGQIILLDDQQVPKTASIEYQSTLDGDTKSGMILAAGMGCIILALLMIVVKMYMAMQIEKNASA